MGVRTNRFLAIAVLPLALLAGCMRGGENAPAPVLQVAGSTATLEIAPVLLAARDHYPAGASVRNGGIGNLVGAPRVEGLGDGTPADVATHAETQALRYSVANPDIRIIMTVTEGSYRIVARRSAGIARIADLKGKRIATLSTTSAGYFLSRMLESDGVRYDEVAAIRISPIEDMAGALQRREVDAVAIWEPHAGNALAVLGTDAISFPGDGIYRELFNLNTTAANLADPDKRARIVAFVRAVITASARIRAEPQTAQALVAQTGGFEMDEVVRAWPTLNFLAALPDDLLDVLVAEEQWLAKQEQRRPRDRATLSRLIDPSILAEATAQDAR